MAVVSGRLASGQLMADIAAPKLFMASPYYSTQSDHWLLYSETLHHGGKLEQHTVKPHWLSEMKLVHIYKSEILSPYITVKPCHHTVNPVPQTVKPCTMEET